MTQGQIVLRDNPKILQALELYLEQYLLQKKKFNQWHKPETYNENFWGNLQGRQVLVYPIKILKFENGSYKTAKKGLKKN